MAKNLPGRLFGKTSAITMFFLPKVKSDKVVAFIKGVPEQPMCGFSKLVVQILDMHGVKFTSFDVLENDSLRRNMKLYSNWPTFPQVFIDGKLVGGADIMLEMHKNKELVQLLEKVGIKSAYSNEEGHLTNMDQVSIDS
uniref:Glutaredoxin-related protein 5, mitochondrial n=1 Tax=Romanomermis culicivorax TaxID=13658 RepID=A0A915KMV0_ROMCU